MRELDRDEAIRQADDLRRRGQERERIRREPFELQNVIQEARKLVRDLRFADAARYCRAKTAGYKGPASEKAQAHCQRLQLLADLHAATVSAINDKSLDVNAAMLFGMAGKAESATDTEIIVSPEPNVKMPRKWSDIKLETLGKLYRRAAGDRPLRMGLPVYLVELHRYDDARAELESTGKAIPALADRCNDVALWLKACDGAERELAAADLLGEAMTAHIQNKNDEALEALTKLQKDYPNANVCLGAVLPKGLSDTVVPVKPIEPKMK
jgi:tetratricopeptide (TPR) repeat protein